MSRYPLNLPVQLKQRAEHWAARQGVSLNQFILWAVAEKVGALDQQLDDPDFPQITYRRGSAGIPWPTLRDSGIRVQTVVVAHHDWGNSAEEIAAEYHLPVRLIREALAFYDAHREEIDSHIALEARLTAAENERDTQAI